MPREIKATTRREERLERGGSEGSSLDRSDGAIRSLITSAKKRGYAANDETLFSRKISEPGGARLSQVADGDPLCQWRLVSIKSIQSIPFELTTFLGAEPDGDRIFILGDELERLVVIVMDCPVGESLVGAPHSDVAAVLAPADLNLVVANVRLMAHYWRQDHVGEPSCLL